MRNNPRRPTPQQCKQYLFIIKVRSSQTSDFCASSCSSMGFHHVSPLYPPVVVSAPVPLNDIMSDKSLRLHLHLLLRYLPSTQKRLWIHSCGMCKPVQCGQSLVKKLSEMVPSTRTLDGRRAIVYVLVWSVVCRLCAQLNAHRSAKSQSQSWGLIVDMLSVKGCVYVHMYVLGPFSDPGFH